MIYSCMIHSAVRSKLRCRRSGHRLLHGTPILIWNVPIIVSTHNILSSIRQWTHHSRLVSQVTPLRLIINGRPISPTFKFFMWNFITLNMWTFVNRIASAGAIAVIIYAVLPMAWSNIFWWGRCFVTDMAAPVAEVDVEISFQEIQGFTDEDMSGHHRDLRSDLMKTLWSEPVD